MKTTGFIFGVFAGASAVIAYEFGTKAKKSVKNSKRMIKEKLDEILE